MNAENLKASLGIEKLTTDQSKLIGAKLKAIATTKQKIADLSKETPSRERNAQAIKQETAALKEKLKTQQGELTQTLDEVRPDHKKAQLTGTQIGTAVAISATTAMMSFGAGKQARSFGETLGTNISGGIMTAMTGMMTMGPAGALLGLIPLASSGIGYLMGETQRAIEVANELNQKWDESCRTLQDTEKTIESIGSRFEQLSKGVDRHGRNVSLSTEEYREYNDIVSQIAEKFPDMITGYTAEGIAILSLKGDVESLTEAYEQMKESMRDEIIADSSKIWKGFRAATQEMSESGFLGSEIRDSLHDQAKFLNQILALKETVERDARGSWVSPNTHYLAGDTSMYSERLKQMLKDAGIDYSKNLADALNDPKNLSKIEAYNRKITAQLNTETSQVKTVIQAHLELDDNYTDEIKTVVDDIIAGIDYKFLISFGSDANIADIEARVGDLVKSISNNPDLQNAFTKFFDSESLSKSVSEYNTIISGAQSSLEGMFYPNNESDYERYQNLMDSLGIKDAQREVNNLRNSLSALTSEAFVDNLFGQINLEEARNINNILSDIANETDRIKAAESLATIFSFDDGKLVSNVRSLQDELSKGEISFVEFKERLIELAQVLEDPDAIETFLSLFERIAPAVSNVSTAISSEFSKIHESFDKLQSAIDKLKNDNTLSAKEIMDLVDGGHIELSDVVIDKDGFMSVPIETFEKGVEKIYAEWNKFIDDTKSGIETSLEGNQKAYDEGLIKYEDYLKEKKRLQEQYDTADTFYNVSFVSNIDSIDFLKNLENSFDKYKKSTSEIARNHWAGEVKKDVDSLTQAFIRGEVEAKAFAEAVHSVGFIVNPIMDALDGQLDKMRSSYTTASKAIEEYNKNGLNIRPFNVNPIAQGCVA